MGRGGSRLRIGSIGLDEGPSFIQEEIVRQQSGIINCEQQTLKA
jgi:hypothetical protein